MEYSDLHLIRYTSNDGSRIVMIKITEEENSPKIYEKGNENRFFGGLI